MARRSPTSWSDSEKAVGHQTPMAPPHARSRPSAIGTPAVFSPDRRRSPEGPEASIASKTWPANRALRFTADGSAHRYVIDVFSRGSNARMPILSFDPKGERIFSRRSPSEARQHVSRQRCGSWDTTNSTSNQSTAEWCHRPMAVIAFNYSSTSRHRRLPERCSLSSTDTIVPVKTISTKSGDWLRVAR
jgi:hypothetical protein